jgi:hypothetical protein
MGADGEGVRGRERRGAGSNGYKESEKERGVANQLCVFPGKWRVGHFAQPPLIIVRLACSRLPRSVCLVSVQFVIN